MNRRALFLLLVGLLTSAAAAPEGRRPRVRLATTTSTYNSGLISALIPPFEKREGVEVQVLAVGTGQALALGERGDADILIVHARQREEKFLRDGHGEERRDLMWNDFVVLGPPADPAGVRDASDVVAALARIAASGERFYSRGDDSGTHIRERALWSEAGLSPSGRPFYHETGQGMGRCLIIADEKLGYVLSDRGTFLAFADRIDLEVLVQGDARLRNPYGVLLVRAPAGSVSGQAARRLMEYLTSPEGQRRIAAFRLNGQSLFYTARPQE